MAPMSRTSRRRLAVLAVLGLTSAATATTACTFAIEVDGSRVERSYTAGAGGGATSSSVSSGQGGAGQGGGPPAECTEATVVTSCGLDSKCRSFVCLDGACAVADAMVGTPCDDDNGKSCDGKGNCVEAHCGNALRDVDESDVDCGGVICRPCGLEATCSKASDCETGFCDAMSGGSGGGRASEASTCAACTGSSDCPNGQVCDVASGVCQVAG
jgi:hypothetical protein